ncbi:hypothetical protein PRK78_000838 [Emydomyces testavorans]|uniref:Leucine rich repeat domain protein n=1 Tax=Emydomyces testavorans TaxID=2070801 RepID=A0AAF0IG16_9EURO|nr:hypothetical protein PRK78_000838 [Emydomyces testavorans]
MEAFLPSYEHAITRDVWAIVAPYIPSADLCAACLVSKRWHEMFVPFLWGAPASHFGMDNDALYVALTRFRKILKCARRAVRELTHTLHLPPAPSEVYDEPRRTWLLEVLEWLPKLQSLLVSGLPFFDHESLTALGARPGQSGRHDAEGLLRTYDLRLLLAESEPNTTSIGLCAALLCFPKLVYVDLSYTTPARDRGVLNALSRLYDLQVLKLRGIGLRDGDIEILANAIGIRVRLLDLRNNLLSDGALPFLLQHCFLPPRVGDEQSERMAECQFEWRLPTIPFGNILTSGSLNCEHIDEHFLKQLTMPLDGRSALEDIPHVGITHLYISDNNLSIEGLLILLKSGRLRALDGGTVNSVGTIKLEERLRSSHCDEFFAMKTRSPEAERLIPILCHPATKNLTYLRIHHSVVTEDCPIKPDISLSSLLAELPTENELCAEQRAELRAVPNEMHELSSETRPAPAYGVADTGITAANHGKGPEISDSIPADDQARIFTTTATGSSTLSQDTISTRVSLKLDSSLPEVPTNQPSSFSQLRNNLIQTLLDKRPAISGTLRCNGEVGCLPFFHPSSLPHLQTLVLTDVPSSIPPSSRILRSLKRFITDCADETLLASLRAQSDYSLPPGSYRKKAEKQHAKSLFALERLVLEVTPVMTSNSPSPWVSASYYTPGHSKSSTGDRDSENLWAAAMHDFSFFSEEGNGVLGTDETDKYSQKIPLNEKRPPSANDSSFVDPLAISKLDARFPQSPTPKTTYAPGNLPQSPSSSRSCHPSRSDPRDTIEPEVDLVAALASFRKEKREKFNGLHYNQRKNKLVNPTLSTHVKGHWIGEVKVVRNPAPSPRNRRVGGLT